MRRPSTAKLYLPGSMTVFLALLLSAFLAVTGILLEYARAQTVSFQLQSAVSAAAESAFAAYYGPLLGQYQLFGRLLPPRGLNGLAEAGEEYISAWQYGIGSRKKAHMTSFEVRDIFWDRCVMMTDEGGAVFRELASEAMKASGVELLESFWDEHLALSDGDFQAILQESESMEEWKPEDLLPSYGDLKEAVEEAEEAAEEQAAQADGEEDTGEASQAEKERLEKEKEEGSRFLRILESVRKVIRGGLLSIVLPEGKAVSEASIPRDGLPSTLSRSEKGRSVRDSGSSGNPFLFREYLMKNMDCYTAEKNKSPLYELEYLAAGKNSDRKNLESVACRILGIRLGLNRLSMARDSEKTALTAEAAALAVGWTGQAWLTVVTDQLLQAVWALAESLADVRILLDGGRVHFLKGSGDWMISLEGAGSAWRNIGGKDGTPKGEGLSYEDHLRICLYLTPLETLSYRGMDVIQWNLQKLDGSFRMNRCLVQGILLVQARGKVLFLPLYVGILRKKKGFFEWEKTAGFGYLEET